MNVKSKGRKIERDIENPVDDLLICICEKINPHLVKIGVTPNMITTLSFGAGLLSVYFLYKSNYVASAISFLLGYFFDCMDGNMAREFNMITKFGDLYDHVTDIGVSIALFIVFMIKDIPLKLKLFTLIIILVFLFLGCMHLGCQEKYYEMINQKASQDGVLSTFRGMCKDRTYINVTKYFGLGTYTVIIVLIILFIKPLSKILK